ncbi:MAG: hypothetical protein KY476_26640 [Planctomycetes bacterium]|nr:hypothetical protein [Planctomycetota bacterium]
MSAGSFSLDDFRRLMRRIRKLGRMWDILRMIPGLKRLVPDELDSDDLLRQIGGVIDAMTPDERSRPETIDEPRCRRIAPGSGQSVREVKRVLKDFERMRQVMDEMAQMSLLDRWRGKWPASFTRPHPN